MGLSHSPSIVTNGLVFAYDMSNTQKSWKGAPTFNASLQNGQNDVNPWSGDGTPTVLGIDPNIRFRGRKVAKFQTGTSGNCYINGVAKLSSSTNSTAWTSTFYLKRVDQAAISTVGVYLYVTGNTNIVTTVSAIAVEDGWYKVTYTGSGLVSGYPTLTGMYSLGSAVQYYFADWQCENLAISTPWVTGTRSTTQAILDQTNNNTITASSLTYASDNTFSFNGSTNYITTTNTGITHGTNNFSYSCWVNFAGLPGLGTIFENGFYTNGILIRFQTNAIGIYAQYSTTSYASSFSFVPTLNLWYHLVITRVGNNLLLYSNGVLLSTIAFGTNINIVPSNNLMYIGMSQHAAGQCFNGRIVNVSVYNRALSAEEVLENFNALRGRYGV